jgi:hypothetical protein
VPPLLHVWRGARHAGTASPAADVIFLGARHPAGALIDADGTATGVPLAEAAGPQRTPRLVASSEREVTVAWAFSDSVNAEPDRIALASFDGKRWNAPQSILRAPELRLSHLTATRAGSVVDPLVVVVTARDATGPVLRVARSSNGTWATADWRGSAFIIHYATASAVAARSVGIVMMATMRGAGAGIYSLRADWDGNGVTWTQPVLIDSLRGSFEEFSSAHLGADSVVVVWYTNPPIGAPKAMMTVVSVDAGITWKSTTALRLNSGVDGARLVVDSGGGLHVVYRGSREDEVHVLNAPGMIMHSSWQLGAWTKPSAVSTTPSVTAPAAGGAAKGRLMVIWAEAEFLPEGGMPRSLAAVWTPGCPRQRR